MHARSPAETGSTGHTAAYRRGCHASVHRLADLKTLRRVRWHFQAAAIVITRLFRYPQCERGREFQLVALVSLGNAGKGN